jgi:hypothetical protein
MLVHALEAHDQKHTVLAQCWEVLQATYLRIPGGLHFESEQVLINKTSRWDVVMDGDKLVALVVYKNKSGLKMSAFAYNRAYQEHGKAALRQLLTQCLQYSWVEVSDHAEPFVLEQCRGQSLRIANRHAPQLLKAGIECDRDGYHYFRIIQGQLKRKLMVGSPNYFHALSVAA